MPTYRLSVEFTAPDDEHARKRAEHIADLTATEHGTRNPVVVPVDGELRDRIARHVRDTVRLRLGPRALEQAATGPIMLSGTEADQIGEAALAALAEHDRPAGAYPHCAFCGIHLDEHPAEPCSPGVVQELRNERDLLRETLAESDLGALTLAQWEAIAAADADRDRLEDERDALKAGIAEAVRQIREWMNPGSDEPLFTPGHAAEVDRTLKKYIGEHVIAALTAQEAAQ